ncbi:MAG: GIY-YIG nuclease family protein [Patescibacteria group bacterium]
MGSTKDLPQRIIKHQRGGVKYAKSRLPVALVFSEELRTYSDARKRERQIKSWKKRIAIERLIKSYSMPLSSPALYSLRS